MDRSIIEQDGSLYSQSRPYIFWTIGDEEITLDGKFTIADLEFLLNHLKSKQDKEPPRTNEYGRVTDEYIQWCRRNNKDPFPNWGNEGNGFG